MVDIEINAWSPGFTKPEIRLTHNHIQYPRKSFEFIQSACHVKMRSLTFEKPVLFFAFLVLMMPYQLNWRSIERM